MLGHVEVIFPSSSAEGTGGDAWTLQGYCRTVEDSAQWSENPRVNGRSTFVLVMSSWGSWGKSYRSRDTPGSSWVPKI